MLVTNVSLRPPRAGIAADIAEVLEATDATATGQLVLATLVDDPANVGDIIDAYLGEIMLEAASAADAPDASIPAVLAADVVETATAAEAPDATLGPTLPSITGLIGWWDASVTASLSLSGANITAVADQSGGGRTMFAAGSGNPTYSATGFNSSTKPAMLFSGGQALATASGFPMGAGTTLTAWFVGTLCNPTGSANDARVMDYIAPGQTDYGAGSWAIYRPGSSTQGINFIRSITGVPTASTYTAYPAPHRIIVTISSGNLITVYIDGVSAATATVAGNWTTAGVAQIGHWTTGSSYWSGPVAEAGIATGYSDATLVGQIDTYLKNKWGL